MWLLSAAQDAAGRVDVRKTLDNLRKEQNISVNLCEKTLFKAEIFTVAAELTVLACSCTRVFFSSTDEM